MPDLQTQPSPQKSGTIECHPRKPGWQDLLKLLGLAKTTEVVVPPVEQPAPTERPSQPCSFDASKPIPPLDPNRFAESCDLAARQIKLDSQRIKGQ